MLVLSPRGRLVRKLFLGLSLLLMSCGSGTGLGTLDLQKAKVNSIGPYNLSIIEGTYYKLRTPSIVGVAAPGDKVTVYNGTGCNGTLLATTYASSAGNFLVTLGLLANDEVHTFSLMATNSFGSSVCSGRNLSYEVFNGTPSTATTTGAGAGAKSITFTDSTPVVLPNSGIASQTVTVPANTCADATGLAVSTVAHSGHNVTFTLAAGACVATETATVRIVVVDNYGNISGNNDIVYTF